VAEPGVLLLRAARHQPGAAVSLLMAQDGRGGSAAQGAWAAEGSGGGVGGGSDRPASRLQVSRGAARPASSAPPQQGGRGRDPLDYAMAPALHAGTAGALTQLLTGTLGGGGVAALSAELGALAGVAAAAEVAGGGGAAAGKWAPWQDVSAVLRSGGGALEALGLGTPRWQ
jgi:hypothetical protein